ncbi:Cyclic nucleotide-gated olfactory channel [Gryllus bimaculatus]|nr:Cyclic nucleotide-gated olfactory channel [Gryllus bimaculatus]
MRAPTIEGYAARHSKLTKSVTFNRDTLSSPPGGDLPALSPPSLAPAPPLSAPPALGGGRPLGSSFERQDTVVVAAATGAPPDAPLPPAPAVSAVSQTAVQVTTTVQSAVVAVTMAETVVEARSCTTTTPAITCSTLESPTKKKPPIFLCQNPQLNISTNQKNFFRPSLLLPSHGSTEEEYFGEIIVGIKQVLQSHLDEIQQKFQLRFQSLELEVKKRDEIISQLQKRIQELETPDTIHHQENGDDGDTSDDLDEASDQPFMVGTS